MTVDWVDIAVKLIVGAVMAIGGVVLSAGTWLVTTVLRHQRDLDAAFIKIRNLEGARCRGDDEE